MFFRDSLVRKWWFNDDGWWFNMVSPWNLLNTSDLAIAITDMTWFRAGLTRVYSSYNMF